VMRKLRKMGHTDPSTGSRRSQDKKMAPSRVKSGRPPPGISETGETTARRASVSNSTRMATSTKVCGPWTRNMDRALTGETRMPNSGESIPATGSRTRSTEEVPSSLRIAIGMMATG
jgi:hypothetical protein